MRWFLVFLLSTPLLAKSTRTLFLSDNKMETVRISPGRSLILSFPARPNKVILGSKGLFGLEYVDEDLALTALQYPAQSNMFVYLEGRRFGFDLKTVPSGGDEIVLIRDAEEQKAKGRVGK